MAEEPQVRCPHCDSEVLADDYACPNCRRVIPWKKEEEPPPKPTNTSAAR